MIHTKRQALAGGAQPRRSDAVYGQLKQKIILSRLSGGQALTELDIAATMGCSQGTVREAMLRLEQEGLVWRQGYRGSVVSTVSALEAQAFLALRAQLEAQALAHSMPVIGPAPLAQLSERVIDMERLARDGDEYGLFEADQAFHIALFQLADMPALVPVLVRCSLYNHRNKMSLRNAPRTLQQTAERHWAIIEALKSGDLSNAQRVLRHHVQSVSGQDDAAEWVAPIPARPQMTPLQRELFDRVAGEDAGLPDITRLPRAAALAQFERVNARWNTVDRAAFDIQEDTLPALPGSRSGPRALGVTKVRCRGLHDERRGTIVHLHGGGWVFGSNQTHLRAMSELARRTGCTVIGVDYGLAPEHPFPQGLNDCVWAWRWLRSRQVIEGPWFIAGDSAGANLAMALMLDLRHLGEPLPEAALLFYGVFDASLELASHTELGSGAFGLSTAKMRWYLDQYLSGSHRDPLNPRVSPLRANLAGLPPLFLNAAGLDPLRDDTLSLAGRLADAGTPYQLHRYEGVVHGFMQMSAQLDTAVRAFDDAAAFIRSHQPAGLPALAI